MKKIVLLCCFSLCILAAEAQIFIFPIVKNSACGNSGGSIELFVGGGTSPYTYSWTNGATTAINSNLSAGVYKVFISDAIGDTASLPIGVFNDPFIDPSFGFLDFDPNTNFYYSCRSVCNGGYRAVESLLNGTAPYTFTAATGTQQVLPNGNGIAFLGHCTGDTIVVTISDANGCQGLFSQPLYGPQRPEMRVLSVQGACNNGVYGSAVFRIPNETGGFSGNLSYEVFSPSTGFTQLQPTALSGVYEAGGLPAGHYYLDRYYSSAYINCEDDTLEFDIPDLGDNCATVKGMVFEDGNTDCIPDVMERGIANQVLKVMPGSNYVVSDASGAYSLTLPFGSYTIEWMNPPATQTCPASAVNPFSLTYINATETVNFAHAPTTDNDAAVYVQAGTGAFTPGSNFSVEVEYSNLGSAPSANAKLYYNFSSSVSFQNASITPDSIGAAVLMWNLGAINPTTATNAIEINFTLSPSATVGAYWQSFAILSNVGSDINMANNTATLNLTVGAPLFDDTKKFAADAWGNVGSTLLVDIDNTIYYTINFKNTTADTAYYLTIVDTLSPNVDISTFHFLASSASCITSIDSTRVLKFYFPSLALPSSSVNELGSRGYVKYSLDVPTSLAGQQAHVLNSASLYFDNYSPLETNMTDVSVDISVGIKEHVTNSAVKLFPNPAKNNLHVRLATGTDALGSVRIYSVDGREVMRQAINENEINLDIHGLTSGTYLFNYQAKSGVQHNLLFVKE
ncbi:MAG: T9SS type A sorting domain-containing protein [Bacteroidetes bacterium]|nr:T9SS type A sorting domain-containing protein [Bacteroidota bacterium]